MIYLILGRPGGGKSYEATVFHVLPALMQGRKVITNLPLNIKAFSAIVPNLSGLLEVRTKSVSRDDEVRVFASPDDYADEWRHPETGTGPLYVIDECHKCLPKIGTSRAVEEWYAEHRHEAADVVLISQSYRKLNSAICDMVDVVYQVQKATALGSADHYVRKVKWGVRGEAVNTSMRKYEEHYFPLYQSHTRGGGLESAAQDIKPIWHHWTVRGAVLLLIPSLLYLVYFFASGGSLFGSQSKAKNEKLDAPMVEYRLVDLDPEPVDIAPAPPAPLRVAHVPEPPPANKPRAVELDPDKGPFQGMGMHVQGWMERGGRQVYAVALSQNGAVSRITTTIELERVGYTVEPVGECAFRASYGESRTWVRCDVPSATVSPFAPKPVTDEPPTATGQAGEGSPSLDGEKPPT